MSKKYEFVPGDEITIAPGRTVKRIRACDLDTEAEDMAHNIIGTIAVAVAGIDDPRDRLAAQVGRLQGMVRKLCRDLAYAQEEVS